MMMTGEMSTLALELIDPFMMTDPVNPHTLDLDLFHFSSPFVVVMLDLFHINVPVSPYFRVWLYFNECHLNYFITTNQ